MDRLPCQKGTSVLPVIQALKLLPDVRTRVPEQLWKYLDLPVLISGWYPERDYWVLIAALEKAIDPQTVGGDTWRYFAKFSAQRDIGGVLQPTNGDEQAMGMGVYRNFANMTDLHSFFPAAQRLWKQYHDTGRMEICGGNVANNSVTLRLLGFVIPLEGFVRLQGYYLEEYGRLVGLELDSSVMRSTARRDPYCEWQFRIARSPESEAYIGSLPPLSLADAAKA